MKTVLLTFAIAFSFSALASAAATAKADHGKTELKDDFTGIYSLDKNSGTATLRKVLVKAGDLLNPPKYEYRLNIEVNDDTSFSDVKLEAAPNGTLIGDVNDDCDDPGCTSTSGDVTVFRSADEQMEISVDYDWFTYADGDEPEVAGTTSLHGHRLKQVP